MTAGFDERRTPDDSMDGSADTAPENIEFFEDETSSPGANPDSPPDAATLMQELERERRERQRLLSERERAEKDRRQAEAIWNALENRSSQPAVDTTRVQALMRAAAELKESDDPRDQVIVELGRELANTQRMLAQEFGSLRGEIAATKIPADKRAAVEKLMETGKFDSQQDALVALMAVESVAGATTPTPRPKPPAGEPTTPARQPVGTGTPPVPRLPAAGALRLKREYNADEYGRLLAENPHRAREIVKAARSGAIRVRIDRGA